MLSQLLEVRITEEIAQSRSVLSLIGDAVFGGGLWFIVLQVFTAGILVLAANTAFQDFPRLSSILARDQFMPSQFRNRGDRLVFSNGVLVLAALALFLVWLYDAELTKPDPALRDRRVHRVHPVAGGDGPALVPGEGRRLALARHPERRGRRRRRGSCWSSRRSRSS